jgi:hypothetical protein
MKEQETSQIIKGVCLYVGVHYLKWKGDIVILFGTWNFHAMCCILKYVQATLGR